MMYTVQKGVPIPPKQGSRAAVYPWAQMAPGDSFVADVPEGRVAIKYGSQIMQQGRAWAKRSAPGAKFTSRAEDDGKRVRVWLVSLPKSLAPLALAPTPPAAGRVHKLEDDEEDDPPKRGPGRPAKTFAHPIPSFTDGAASRVVKGKRY